MKEATLQNRSNHAAFSRLHRISVNNSGLIIIDSGLPKVRKDIDERIWKAAEEFVRPEDMEYNHVITSTAGSSFDEETDYNG